MHRRRTFTVMVFAPLALVAAVTASCEERFPAPLRASSGAAEVPDTGASFDAGDAGEAGDAGDASVIPDVSAPDVATGGICNVRLEAPAIEASPHVPAGIPVAYTSNPPSSGPHYSEWANFQEFTHPVDDGYLVHAMEHGAVLLLYKCDDDAGACADLVARLRAVRDAVPTDPLCDQGVRVRVILAPRATNDTAVAAAAWGNTYRADCVDASSLAEFIAAYYGKAPENFCIPGTIF